MEKLRGVVVVLQVMLLISLLPDLGGCYDADAEQGTASRGEDARSGSAARLIQGDRARKFLQEQNSYWSGHLGSKAGWLDFINYPPPAYTGGGNFQGKSFSPPSTSTPNQPPPYP